MKSILVFLAWLVGLVGVVGVGIVWIRVGYLGIEHHFGDFWASLAVLAVFFRIPIPLAIGVFFWAWSVWHWHWALSFFFAAPGLLLVMGSTLEFIIEFIKRPFRKRE